MWVTIIEYQKDNKDQLIKVFGDIANKDPTFIWSINEAFVSIESGDKDAAYKRGTWLVNRVQLLQSSGYKVYNQEMTD